MTDQEKRERNEKLAKWAGFDFWEEGSGEKIGEITGVDVIEKVEYFHYPDGEWDCIEGLPIFTDSLDACFKWLVPKLRSNEDYVDINLRDFHPEMGDPYLFTIRMMVDYPVIKAWQAGAETPALALCLAIEKLIENGLSIY